MKKALFMLTLLSSVSLFAQDKKGKKIDKTILPIILYDPFTGLGYGGLANVNFLLGDSATTRYSNAQAIAMRTTRNQNMLQLNHQLFTNGEKRIYQGKWMFLDWPENTYGLGANTSESAKELISYRALEIDERLLFRIKNSKSFIGPDYRLYSSWNLQSNKSATESFFEQKAIGKPSYIASGIGVHFVHDSRDHVQNAYKGKFIEVALNPYLKATGSTQNWTNIRLDARHYFSFGATRKTIATRALYEQAIGDVPYMLTPMPGRYNATRGYVQGRYRGKGFIALETEVRTTIYKWFGIVGFVNAHSISEPNGDFAHINPAAGAGLRFMLNKAQRTNLRIDYAKGKGENSGIYFQITEVF